MSDSEKDNHHHDLFGNETSIVAFETPEGGGLLSDTNKYGIIPLMIVIFLMSFLFVGFFIYCSKRQEAKKRKAAAETLEKRQRMRELAASKLALPEVGNFVGVPDPTESTIFHLDAALDLEEAGSLLSVSTKGVPAHTETNGNRKVAGMKPVEAMPKEKDESSDKAPFEMFRVVEAGSAQTAGNDFPDLEPKTNVVGDIVVTRAHLVEGKTNDDESVDKNPKVRLFASNAEGEEIKPTYTEERKKKRKLSHVGDFGTERDNVDEATEAKLPALHMNEAGTLQPGGQVYEKEDDKRYNEKAPDATLPSSLDTVGLEPIGADAPINQEEDREFQTTDKATNLPVPDADSPGVEETKETIKTA